MTGTGTSENPYIVRTWEEFTSVAVKGSVYIEFDAQAENKTLDFSEIAPTGVSAIAVRAESIKGNGWTLRNMYVPGTLFTNAGASISGFTFSNIYHTGASFIVAFGSASVYGADRSISNCLFTGVTYATVFYNYTVSAHTSLYYCGFNLQCKADTFRLMAGTANSSALTNNRSYMTSCNAMLDLSGVVSPSSLLGSVRAANNLITINSPKSGDIIITASTISNDYMRNNVILGEHQGDIIIKETTSNYLNLYNKTTLTGVTDTAKFVGCTTAQLSDADYLSSIGFPIGKDGDPHYVEN